MSEPNQTPERIDLVLPVYNEAHVLEGSVTRLLDEIRGWPGFAWRIVIVDNASVDGTDDVARRLAGEHASVEFERLPIKGRGHALRWAWTETDADFSMYMDIDLSTDLIAVPQALAELRSGADVVIGSRLDPDSRTTRSPRRDFISRVYNHLVHLVFWSRSFRDAQCGFKVIRLSTVRSLVPHVVNNDWFFDTELLLLCEYGGLKLVSIPVRWIEDPDSRVNIGGSVVEHLRGLLRVRRTMGSVLASWER